MTNQRAFQRSSAYQKAAWKYGVEIPFERTKLSISSGQDIPEQPKRWPTITSDYYEYSSVKTHFFGPANPGQGGVEFGQFYSRKGYFFYGSIYLTLLGYFASVLPGKK